MKFVSIRELRNNTAAIRRALRLEREIIITARGKPVAMLTDLNEKNFEQEIRARRGARLIAVLSDLHVCAKKTGTDKLTMKQIDAIIARVRSERRRNT